MRTKQGLPTRAFKRHTVAIAMNGGVPLETLAEVLKVPLAGVKRWHQNFQGQIQPRRWSAPETETQMSLLKAVSQRVRAQARIVRLRGVLKQWRRVRMLEGLHSPHWELAGFSDSGQ